MIYCAALTSRGALVARRLACALPGGSLHLPRGLSSEFGGATAFSSIREFFEDAFENASGIVCVMACGIVVRGVKDHLQSKSQDPAIVVVDEGARFAISLVSGHLGGANELARRVAAMLGGQAVITTATDTRGLPALDDMARVLHMDISSMDCLKRIHMSMLEGGTIRILDRHGMLRRFLKGKVPGCVIVDDSPGPGEGGKVSGGFIPYYDAMITVDHLLGLPPFLDTHSEDCLILRPRVAYFVGVGCNSGTSAQEIVSAIEATFASDGLDIRLLATISTIDKKRGEPGLIEAARRLFCPMEFFPGEELAKVPVPNPSSAPLNAVGSPSVAEAAAILATRGHGALLVEKKKMGNVTAAVASVPPHPLTPKPCCSHEEVIS